MTRSGMRALRALSLLGRPTSLHLTRSSSRRSRGSSLAMSHQIGRELRRLHDKKGVTHIHLFAALPAALAVMVGHQMNALCAITLYHHMEKDGLYVPVCTLGKQKAPV